MCQSVPELRVSYEISISVGRNISIILQGQTFVVNLSEIRFGKMMYDISLLHYQHHEVNPLCIHPFCARVLHNENMIVENFFEEMEQVGV